MTTTEVAWAASAEAFRYLLSIIILLLGWQTTVTLLGIPHYVLPSPVRVFSTLVEESGMYSAHARVTLENMLAGAAIGIGLGVAVGFLIAYSRTLLWLCEPYLVIFQSFPREALIPVIVVWLGFGSGPKVVNAALLSFFPIALVTINNLLDTRAEYLELVRSWGASKRQEFLYCRLPYALQSIVGGLKISLPLALIGAVLGEFMGGNEGLGHVIVSSGANFRLDRSFAALVVLAGIGMITLAAVRLLQDRVFARFKQE